MRVGVTTEPDEITRQRRSFWEQEHLGIVEDAQLTTKDDNVLRVFGETIVHKSGRYKVTLLWRENASDLADNKSTASHTRAHRVRRTATNSVQKTRTWISRSSCTDLKVALAKMKRGMAPGRDKITAKPLVNLADRAYDTLFAFISSIWLR
ncbi:hypothetical protein HPB49_010071 [Dermacentor silvarum]|uniref:Uncharacterized protein n=1 Tax=Dermacentor silvarum TaxID=543639 RepID=A0ACB8CWK5_DERSI|nr:hypothetical protein HPB49_010071 [Dermacentor silvarum]